MFLWPMNSFILSPSFLTLSRSVKVSEGQSAQPFFEAHTKSKYSIDVTHLFLFDGVHLSEVQQRLEVQDDNGQDGQ